MFGYVLELGLGIEQLGAMYLIVSVRSIIEEEEFM